MANDSPYSFFTYEIDYTVKIHKLLIGQKKKKNKSHQSPRWSQKKNKKLETILYIESNESPRQWTLRKGPLHHYACFAFRDFRFRSVSFSFQFKVYCCSVRLDRVNTQVRSFHFI